MYRVQAVACAIDEPVPVRQVAGGLLDRLSLTRARGVAGDQALAARFVDALREFLFEAMPDRGAIEAFSRGDDGAEPVGGARQVERVTALFQLAHGAQHPALNQIGTLAALDALATLGLVHEGVKRELSQAYVFLRTVEHRLQLVQNHQTGLGSSEDLEKQLAVCRHRVAELSAALIQPFANGR
jgi:glutamate-ammonia-ligase adenylyltransferase